MAPAGFKTPEGKVHVKGRSRDNAARFLKLAEEQGIDAAEIITTSVGYLVPESLVKASAEKAEEGGAEGDGGETPDGDLQPYDPSQHTVDEVAEYLEGADEAERDRVIAAEAEGKNRKGILDLATTGKDAE